MFSLKKIIKDLIYTLLGRYFYQETLSFSQSGEDKILEFLFGSMGIQKISYLDIGTNDPIKFNNTFLFYLKGSLGVCVEANPSLIPKIKKYRPNDICLNVGVGKESSHYLDFFIFDEQDKAKGLSTFSKKEVEHIEATTSIKVSKIEKISVITINEILETHFKTKVPDFISIDVEGLDLGILQSLNFNLYRPIAICVETVDFTLNHKKTKRKDIINFMLSKGYFIYADTGINSIFADKRLF